MAEIDYRLKHVHTLNNMGACLEALHFASGFQTAQEAWDACHYLSWLRWLCLHLGYDKELKPVAEEAIRRLEAALVCTDLGNAIVQRGEQALKHARELYAIGAYNSAIGQCTRTCAENQPEELCAVVRKYIPVVPTQE